MVSIVGETRRGARPRAARRSALTFRNDEVAAQRRRWTFYETIILYFFNVLASSLNSLRAASVDMANPRPSNLWVICFRVLIPITSPL